MPIEPSLAEKIDRIDASQDALLVHGQSVQEQLQTMMGLLTDLVQLLTQRPEKDAGMTLDELLGLLIQQQKEHIALTTQILHFLTQPNEGAAQLPKAASSC
jgi:hypothetical protein